MYDPLPLVSGLVHVVPAWLVLLMLGACIALESGVLIGMALPGATAVLALGVAGGMGVAPLPVCLAVAAAAAVTGTQLAYQSGARSGRRAEGVNATPEARGRWVRAQHLMERHDLMAVPVAQFVVVTRTLVPRLAGLGGTSWSRFTLVSIPAATAWATALTTTGYRAGTNIDAAAQALSTVGTSLTVLTAGLLVMAARACGRRAADGRAGTPNGPALARAEFVVHQAHNE